MQQLGTQWILYQPRKRTCRGLNIFDPRCGIAGCAHPRYILFLALTAPSLLANVPKHLSSPSFPFPSLSRCETAGESTKAALFFACLLAHLSASCLSTHLPFALLALRLRALIPRMKLSKEEAAEVRVSGPREDGRSGGPRVGGAVVVVLGYFFFVGRESGRGCLVLRAGL